MPVSIKQHFKHQPTQQSIESLRVMGAVLEDMTALHAAFLSLTAQMDADGGITDTDYAANNDPAALTLTA